MRSRMFIVAIVAALAALIAVPTGGFAAAKHLITGKNVKNGSLSGADIKNGSVTNKDIKKGSIRLDKLSKGTQRLIRKAGGVGATGKTGAQGPQGPAGTSPGSQGVGASGANPATPVKASGDSGFTFSGANSTDPKTASFARGALHLPGGFDGKTAQGGIGLAKQYNNVPLSNLSAVGYKFSVNKQGGGDTATIHVSVTGAVKGGDAKASSASGFTNFVYNPGINGLTGREATVDAFAPGNKWYSTGTTSGSVSGGMQNPINIQTFQARNPDAVIGQISVDNGGTSGSGTTAPDATDISVDNLILGFGPAFTRYDLGG